MLLLSGLLEKFIKNGTLRLYDASGRLHTFGGKLPGPAVTLRLNRRGLAANGGQKLLRRLWRALRRWHQANPTGIAASQARHHYDLSTELYRLFLDDDMQYSCAYFRDPAHDSLEDAQRYKLIHATAKLQLA